MLTLQSSRWSEITHAYGSAEDIPALLLAAAKLPPSDSNDDEPYFSLWSALCHQGDVYEASYAALPHLADIVRANPQHVVVSVVDLISAIETARLQGRGPVIPEDLSASYCEALSSLMDHAAQLLAASEGEEQTRVVLSVLAAAKGFGRLSAAIAELNPAVTETFLERWLFE